MKSAATDMVAMLLIGTGDCVHALPLDHVVETMRPLPVEPLPGCPDFVAGLAVIRGEPVPVVTLAALTGIRRARSERFVTIQVHGRADGRADERMSGQARGQTDGRLVALAVERVIGVRRLDAAGLAAAPPLLGRPDLVAHLGTLDGALLLVLETGHLLPPDLLPLPGMPPAPLADDGIRP